MNDDAEVDELRAVALKNAESILNARRRAEREQLAANEALERKTEELLEQRRSVCRLERSDEEMIGAPVHGFEALDAAKRWRRSIRNS